MSRTPAIQADVQLENMKIQFTAPLQGMWDEMQVNLADHNIAAVRSGETATFTGQPDDIDCFISKHYDGSGVEILTKPVA